MVTARSEHGGEAGGCSSGLPPEPPCLQSPAAVMGQELGRTSREASISWPYFVWALKANWEDFGEVLFALSLFFLFKSRLKLEAAVIIMSSRRAEQTSAAFTA